MSEVLVHVSRGELVENIHRGDIVVVDDSGKIIAKVGDPYKVTFMRSCSKPIQASAVFESGAVEQYGMTEKEIAVLCASHYAEPFHVEAVSSILEKCGADESMYRCGATYSINEKVTEAHMQSGSPKRKIFNNCSGKHAGMLALAMKEGYDIATYDDLDNPVQQKMLETVAEYTEMKKEDIAIGIDGCGVPVFGMPIYNMALSFTRFANTESLKGKRKEAAQKIAKAMMAYPEMVSGTGGVDTELMKHTKGKIVCKIGADAVHCIGIVGKGLAIAVKIEDGNSRIMSAAVIETLKQLNVLTAEELEALRPLHIKDNVNWGGTKCGEVKPVFELEFCK